MFKFSIPIINNRLAKEDKPFFITYMTVSDHGPYYIPPYFEPKSENIKDQIVEYADWSLKKFITDASSQPWFDNTIFVFVADHGAPISATYDISLDYHHSPLLYYAPKLLDTIAAYDDIGGQIDLFPTLMGLLNLPYINNTLGVDLLKTKRPYIYFNGDDKIGVLDHEFLYIFKNDMEPKLVKYTENDLKNYIDSFPKKAADMEKYAKSNMQVFQYLLNEDKLKVE
jgi:phosphoglycerol transferase MdoB-like AlkP superfamily enzyme